MQIIEHPIVAACLASLEKAQVDFPATLDEHGNEKNHPFVDLMAKAVVRAMEICAPTYLLTPEEFENAKEMNIRYSRIAQTDLSNPAV